MRTRWWVRSTLLLFAVLGLFAARRSQSQPQAQRVGAAACKDCHAEIFQQYATSAHGRAATDSGRLPENMDCETCHGPGSLHVAANGETSDPGFKTIWNPAKRPAGETNATCLTCHNGGEQFYWQSSAHNRKEFACVQCHSMHASKDVSHTKLLKYENTSDLCASCHKSKHLNMYKSGHMPVREGSIDCASCHNPHGSANPRMLRANTVNELCTSCHADKRGPMLWEHPPVRENCITCHEPHGANNDKVLTAKKPFLCQRCHVASGHPSTLYDLPDLQSNRLLNRSCTNCHSQIHGSNNPSGRFFTR